MLLDNGTSVTAPALPYYRTSCTYALPYYRTSCTYALSSTVHWWTYSLPTTGIRPCRRLLICGESFLLFSGLTTSIRTIYSGFYTSTHTCVHRITYTAFYMIMGLILYANTVVEIIYMIWAVDEFATRSRSKINVNLSISFSF